MIVEDQSEAISFLSRPQSYGAGTEHVARIDTHGAVVFLAGSRAYKMKRAVRFPYMDYSTLKQRREACGSEIYVNRRTAPALYIGVAALVRDKGGELRLGEPREPDDPHPPAGEVVEWLVVMRRFDQEALLDRMARHGELGETLMIAVADIVARFHRQAEPRTDRGGSGGLRWVLESNAQSFAEAPAGAFDPAEVARLNEAAQAMLARHADLLDARRNGGFVRHCHGDLHLRNICLIDGQPTLFDAIEFNEQVACIDVLYDLAFLLMDLDHRGLRDFANLVFNRYLAHGNDLAGLPLMPLFLSARAAVRSHISAAAGAAQADAEQARELFDEGRAYLTMALECLSPPAPRLIGIGGLSGSGKSRLACRLAPFLGASPGALVLRSDVLRKRLFDRPFEERLPQAAYAEEVTEKVYTEMHEAAATALAAGQVVIADAVYASPAQRAALEGVADKAGVPFAGLWLEAPPEVMEQRVRRRRHDASDATVDVLHAQLGYRLGKIGWTRLDASASSDQTLATARAALGAGE
jgi:aminoglycoside phosphotransferase family enzyme/predicted kinase